MEFGDVDLDGSIDLISSDDNNINYWTIGSDGKIGEKKVHEVQLGAIREFQIVNALAEDFLDLVIVNGFGTTICFSDKLNASINQISVTKIFDNQPFDNFYDVSSTVEAVILEYEGFQDIQVNVGNYKVFLTIDDPIYEGLDTMEIAITKRTLTVTAKDTSSYEGDAIPQFTVLYDNFATDNDESDLSVLPNASTDATNESPAGEYIIIVSGAEAQNYAFIYVDGILTIMMPLSLEQQHSGFHLYPNPTKQYLSIETIKKIKGIYLTSLDGKTKELEYHNGIINLWNNEKGLNILKIKYADNTYETIKLLIE